MNSLKQEKLNKFYKTEFCDENIKNLDAEFMNNKKGKRLKSPFWQCLKSLYDNAVWNNLIKFDKGKSTNNLDEKRSQN